MESSNHNVPPEFNEMVDGKSQPVELIGGYVLDFLRHQENYTTNVENIIEALARDVELNFDDVSGLVKQAIEDGIALSIISRDQNGMVKSNLDFSEIQKYPKGTQNKEPKTELVPLQDPPKLKPILKNAGNYMPEASQDKFPMQKQKPKMSINTKMELDFLAELGVGEVREENSIFDSKAKKRTKAKKIRDDKRPKGCKGRKRR